mgnify:FL=1
MLYLYIKTLAKKFKHIFSVPSTQAITSLLLIISSIVLVATTTIGTKILSTSDLVDVNRVKVNSTSTERRIGDAAGLSRFPISKNNIVKDEIGESNSTTSTRTSKPNVNDTETKTTTTTTLLASNRLINSFSYSIYTDGQEVNSIIYSWATKPINVVHRYLIKISTNRLITNEDQTLVIKENIEVDNYNAVTTYSDLGDEGLYLEIQYKDNSGNWILQEQSQIKYF